MDHYSAICALPLTGSPARHDVETDLSTHPAPSVNGTERLMQMAGADLRLRTSRTQSRPLSINHFSCASACAFICIRLLTQWRSCWAAELTVRSHTFKSAALIKTFRICGHLALVVFGSEGSIRTSDLKVMSLAR